MLGPPTEEMLRHPTTAAVIPRKAWDELAVRIRYLPQSIMKTGRSLMPNEVLKA